MAAQSAAHPGKHRSILGASEPVLGGDRHQPRAAVARSRLRAHDAVQLAAALAARDADPTLEGFACFDGELAAVARLEGFRILGSD